MIKKIAVGVLAVLAYAGAAQAQTTVTPTNKLVWNEQGPDLPTVQAYVFKVYADGAAAGTVAAAVVCGVRQLPDTTGFTCFLPFPAFTPGSHTLTLTASNAAGESAQSAALAFTMLVTPVVPGGLRIQ